MGEQRWRNGTAIGLLSLLNKEYSSGGDGYIERAEDSPTLYQKVPLYHHLVKGSRRLDASKTKAVLWLCGIGQTYFRCSQPDGEMESDKPHELPSSGSGRAT